MEKTFENNIITSYYYACPIIAYSNTVMKMGAFQFFNTLNFFVTSCFFRKFNTICNFDKQFFLINFINIPLKTAVYYYIHSAFSFFKNLSVSIYSPVLPVFMALIKAISSISSVVKRWVTMPNFFARVSNIDKSVFDLLINTALSITHFFSKIQKNQRNRKKTLLHTRYILYVKN